MGPELYEVVSQGARYWFLFLMVLIVWRSYRWLARDRKQRKKRLRLLPDAGYVGEMVVQSGNEALPPGAVLPVTQEGLLGCTRGSDLFVPVHGVKKSHLLFRYDEDRGLLLFPFARCPIQVDGAACENRHKGLSMSHGSRLAVGEAVLRLRMFAGFETTAHATARGEGSPNGFPDESAGSGPPSAIPPEQLAVWQAQQQYWQMAAQMMATQAGWAGSQGLKAQGKNARGAENENEEDADDEESYGEDPCEENGYEASLDDETTDGEALGYVVLTEGGVAESTGRAPRASRTPARFAAPEDLDTWEEDGGPETVFLPTEAFYPPVQEEGAPEDAWPYVAYPKSAATFQNSGYTYPEYAGDAEEGDEEDEDLTDAAAPPKSMYVEPDEAEQAKRVLWDKYLGGGSKR